MHALAHRRQLLIIICSLTTTGLLAEERTIAYKIGPHTWTSETVIVDQTAVAKPGVQSVGFTAVYDDVTNGNGIGFDHPELGSARRAMVEEVFTYLEGVLNVPGTAEVHFGVSETDGSGALAWGGTYWFYDEGFDNGFAFDHLTTGEDPYGGYSDINVTIDFGWSWYEGDASPAYDQLDLRSVLLHEIGHGLGLTSLIDSDGSPEITGTYTVWDQLITTGHEQALFDQSASFIGQASWVTGSDNGLVFTGSYASTWLGAPATICAPDPYEPGSSTAHFDQYLADPTGAAIVMRPALVWGTMAREFAPVELAALRDIGYTDAAFVHLRRVDLAVSDAADDPHDPLDIVCADVVGPDASDIGGATFLRLDHSVAHTFSFTEPAAVARR